MAKDKYHDLVKRALVKDGWKITQDPFTLKLPEYGNLFIDIAAEKFIKAIKGTQEIVVEVKSFIGLSPITNLYEALGKFDVYKIGLEEVEPDKILFLAIPDITWYDVFQKPFAQKLIERKNLRIIVYDKEKEEIALWIK